jgi:hypothetical protein
VTDGTTIREFVLSTQALVDAARTTGVSTTFAAPADGATFNVSTTLRVAASGNVSNPGTDSAKLDLTDFSKVDPTDPTKRITAVDVNIDTDAVAKGDGVITITPGKIIGVGPNKIEVDSASLLGIVAEEVAEVEAEKVCTIRNRTGNEVVEIPIPCTN